jgi:sec-independent protein translocase protein TatB
MFNGLGWEELLVLAVLGLLIFGPDRLPKAAQDLGRLLRQLRQMASGAANDLKAELGPELADVDFRSLNPRKFVEDALFGDDEPATAHSRSITSPAMVTLEANERPPYDVDAT